MKKIRPLLAIFVLLSQFFVAQELSLFQKDSIKTCLNDVLEKDQHYRRLTMPVKLQDQNYLDSLEKCMPKEELIKFLQSALTKGKTLPKRSIDSLMRLQSTADSINSIIIEKIVKVYGYPSKSRTGFEHMNVLLLHQLGVDNYKRFNVLFLTEIKKGNMHGGDYAMWMDRYLLIEGKPQLYGEYNKAYPCVEDLNKSNKERKKLGLEPLKENRCMDLNNFKGETIIMKNNQ